MPQSRTSATLGLQTPGPSGVSSLHNASLAFHTSEILLARNEGMDPLLVPIYSSSFRLLFHPLIPNSPEVRLWRLATSELEKLDVLEFCAYAP